jgi:hypothetical protein
LRELRKIAVVADEEWKDPFLMYLAAGHRKARLSNSFPWERRARPDNGRFRMNGSIREKE